MTRTDPDDLDKVFKALGHITRRRILRLLAQNPRYPYELGKLLDLNRRLVLKHLDALQDAALVEREVGDSDVGPERTYYRLKANFGLSTTILPNAFVMRVTHKQHPAEIATQSRSISRDPDSDVKAVRRLLRELDKTHKQLGAIDEERMRLASVRAQIIRHIEGIMNECKWDQESCQRVRSLIDPVRMVVPAEMMGGKDLWSESIREALSMFEKMFSLPRRSKAPEKQDDLTEKEVPIEFE
ncbi:MAG: helix-turn-helix domain-containing protein [Candidatus Thorarchaeota archaeon]